MQNWLTDKLGITTWHIRYFPCCDEPGYGYLIVGQDVVLEYDIITNLYKTSKEATLAAIDAALDYLKTNENEK